MPHAMMTRSKARKFQEVKGDWEEVYSVREVSAKMLKSYKALRFRYKHEYETGHFGRYNDSGRGGTLYYQTYGGGPEGGYFVKYYTKEDGTRGCCGIYEVQRTWGEPFKTLRSYDGVQHFGSRVEYQPADYDKGLPARCRLVLRTYDPATPDCSRPY